MILLSTFICYKKDPVSVDKLDCHLNFSLLFSSYVGVLHWPVRRDTSKPSLVLRRYRRLPLELLLAFQYGMGASSLASASHKLL